MVVASRRQRSAVGAEGHADDTFRVPGEKWAALPARGIEQTDDDSFFLVGRCGERRSVWADGERGVGAVDQTHLCIRCDVDDRRATGAGNEQLLRVGEKRHVTPAVCRRECGTAGSVRPPVVTSQTIAIAGATTGSGERIVRHAGDISAVRADHEACRRILAEDNIVGPLTSNCSPCP